MDDPVDCHSHRFGDFDFAEPERIDLVEIDPQTAATQIERLCEKLAVSGSGPIATDHLFNDMPLNFKHTWRTHAERARRTEELGRVLEQKWIRENMAQILGPVPAAVSRQAFRGNLPIFNIAHRNTQTFWCDLHGESGHVGAKASA